MKKIVSFLFLTLITTSIILSQEKNESIDSVNIASDTAYVEVEYNFYYDGNKYYDGVAGYQFTVSEDTITKISLEGGYDGINYISIVDCTNIASGNYAIYDTYPEFYKYRLGVYGGSSDTTTLKNIIYFEKQTK